MQKYFQRILSSNPTILPKNKSESGLTKMQFYEDPSQLIVGIENEEKQAVPARH